MSVRQTLPVREVLRGRRISWVDVVVGAAIIAILYEVVHLGQSLAVNFTPGRTPVVISTDISNVPYYAARSLLRMFIALGLSTIFTLVYGTAAARLRRAEKVLVPILDVLQSIPRPGSSSGSQSTGAVIASSRLRREHRAARTRPHPGSGWHLTAA